MIVGHNRVISCSLIRNAVIFAPPFLWFWKSVDFDEKSLCECKKCHRGRYIWRRNGKRTLLFAYQRHARLSVFNCFALTPRLQHEKHWLNSDKELLQTHYCYRLQQYYRQLERLQRTNITRTRPK